jgi:hypothetical protein
VHFIEEGRKFYTPFIDVRAFHPTCYHSFLDWPFMRYSQYTSKRGEEVCWGHKIEKFQLLQSETCHVRVTSEKKSCIKYWMIAWMYSSYVYNHSKPKKTHGSYKHTKLRLHMSILKRKWRFIDWVVCGSHIEPWAGHVAQSVEDDLCLEWAVTKKEEEKYTLVHSNMNVRHLAILCSRLPLAHYRVYYLP